MPTQAEIDAMADEITAPVQRPDSTPLKPVQQVAPVADEAAIDAAVREITTQPLLPAVPTHQQDLGNQLRGYAALMGKGIKGIGSEIYDAFTGESKQTDRSRSAPSLMGTKISELAGNDEFSAEKLMFAGALTFTYDPQEAANLVQSVSKYDVSVDYDDKKNAYIILKDPKSGTSKEYLFNPPGMDSGDVAQMAASGLVFTPAGRAGIGANSLIQGAGKVALASGATQAGIDAGRQVAGADLSDDQIGSNIASGMLTAGLTEYGMQAIARSVSPDLVSRVRQYGVDNDVRHAIRETARAQGMNVDVMDDDTIARIIMAADDLTGDAAQIQATLGEVEFPEVRLTRGQRTGEYAQLKAEDHAKAGQYGQTALDKMQDHIDENIVGANNASQRIRKEIIGREPFTDKETRGTLISETVKKAKAEGKKQVNEAYKAVGDAELPGRHWSDLVRESKQAISGDDFVTDPGVADLTRSFLNDLDGAAKSVQHFDNIMMTGGNLNPVHINKIDKLRKKLNILQKQAVKQGKDSDVRNLTTLKHKFDELLDQAIETDLFTGSPESLGRLKEARSVYADYARKFKSSNQSDVDSMIKKIIEKDPTGAQVVNHIFGLSKINRDAAASYVKALKRIVGDRSDAFKALQDETMTRLIAGKTIQRFDKSKNMVEMFAVDGKGTLKAVNDAMTNHKQLMLALFGQDQINKIRRFGQHVARANPDMNQFKSKLNPSGSGLTALQGLPGVLGNAFRSGKIEMMNSMIAFPLRFYESLKATSAIRPFKPYQSVNSGAVTGVLMTNEESEVN